MRKIWIALLLAIILSCSSSNGIQEGVFYKTKYYAGVYESSTFIDDKTTMVVTTYGIFKLKENPDIPDGAFCYIRIEYPSHDFHPDIEEQMTSKYLTWAGHDSEYRITSKLDTRVIRIGNEIYGNGTH